MMRHPRLKYIPMPKGKKKLIKKKSNKELAIAERLTDKHYRFIEEYCVDQNAKQAAIRAGYSEKTAESQGSRLLSIAKVSDAIKNRQLKIAKDNDIKREDIIKSVQNKAKANMMDYAEWCQNSVRWRPSSELTREQGARIKSLTETINNAGHRSIRIELYDALAADKLLAQMTGNIVERREHSGVGGKPIQHEHKGVMIDLTKLTMEQLNEYKRLQSLVEVKEENNALISQQKNI